MSYDVIGDIHGHASKLSALLKQLGYNEIYGVWRHANRTALFVGDFIDRGPEQIETLTIVRNMVDAGAAKAVMGNHEFNAIAYYLRDPLSQESHLRPRTTKNQEQHDEFLKAVCCDSKLHEDWIDWFLTLPLWLDLPELRVVHACWHPTYMQEISHLLDEENRLNANIVADASREGSMPFRAIEGLLKGLEVELPYPLFFLDKDGHRRTSVRTRWWDAGAQTFRQAALIDKKIRGELPETLMPHGACIGYSSGKPVFFGHYWNCGVPKVITPKIACVDYSAGKGGPLVAYQWQGESELTNDHFVYAS